MRRLSVLLLYSAPLLAQTDVPGAARSAAQEFATGEYSALYERFSAEMKMAVQEDSLPGLARQLFGEADEFLETQGTDDCQPVQGVQGVQACTVRVVFKQSVVTLLLPIDADGNVAGLRILGTEPRAEQADTGFSAPNIATEVATLLAQRQFDELWNSFSNQMRIAMPRASLPSVAESILAAGGEFKSLVSDPDCSSVGLHQRCLIGIGGEKGETQLSLTIDAKGKLAGIFRTGFQPDIEALDTNMEIPVGDYGLPGYLTLPDTEGPHPVIVLVHGSGAHDADETIGPNKPFRDLADGLAARGVGTLRYFKRNFIRPLPAEATLFDEVIDDALTAIALTRGRDGVDPDRVFVLGHSLGGYLAPLIAERAPNVRGVVLMAGSNRPMRELLRDQVRHLTGSDAAFDQAWQSLPVHYQELVPDYDALQTAAGLHRPILVLQGQRDYQVTIKDFERWKVALDDQETSAFFLYPSLNHLFLPGVGKSLPAEYQVEGHIPAQVLDDIANWVLSYQ